MRLTGIGTGVRRGPGVRMRAELLCTLGGVLAELSPLLWRGVAQPLRPLGCVLTELAAGARIDIGAVGAVGAPRAGLVRVRALVGVAAGSLGL